MLLRKDSQQSDGRKRESVSCFSFTYESVVRTIFDIGTYVKTTWRWGEACAGLNLCMAGQPITSGCCIYKKKVKQVAESLCGARHESGPNAVPSQTTNHFCLKYKFPITMLTWIMASSFSHRDRTCASVGHFDIFIFSPSLCSSFSRLFALRFRSTPMQKKT